MRSQLIRLPNLRDNNDSEVLTTAAFSNLSDGPGNGIDYRVAHY